MNFKKFISGVSALTIAASAFAAMAVTANAATSYTEDFSAVEDAGAWWSSINGDLTASITDGGAMQLVNGSTSGNRAASKTVEYVGSAGVTIDMDVYANRGDRSTTWTISNGSNILATIARTANNADGQYNRIVITDAAGESVTSVDGNIEKFHVSVDANFEAGTVDIKATNVYDKDNKKKADVELSGTTSATTGAAGIAVEVRRGGTTTIDNIVVAGKDRIVTTPEYDVPSYAVDVNNAVTEYVVASDNVYGPKVDNNDGVYEINTDFMLDTEDSVLQLYPYSTKGGGAVTNTPLRFEVGSVVAEQKNAETYNANIAAGEWYRVTTAITNYAGTMNVKVVKISDGTEVFNQNIGVRNNGSMRFRQYKVAAVEGTSYVANVAIYGVDKSYDKGYSFTQTVEEVADKTLYVTATINGENKMAEIGNVGTLIDTVMTDATAQLTVFLSNIPADYENVGVVID